MEEDKVAEVAKLKHHVIPGLDGGFSALSRFLERIRIEYKETKDSLESKLQIHTSCSIRKRSKNREIFEKRTYIKVTKN